MALTVSLSTSTSTRIQCSFYRPILCLWYLHIESKANIQQKFDINTFNCLLFLTLLYAKWKSSIFQFKFFLLEARCLRVCIHVADQKSNEANVKCSITPCVRKKLETELGESVRHQRMSSFSIFECKKDVLTVGGTRCMVEYMKSDRQTRSESENTKYWKIYSILTHQDSSENRSIITVGDILRRNRFLTENIAVKTKVANYDVRRDWV